MVFPLLRALRETSVLSVLKGLSHLTIRLLSGGGLHAEGEVLAFADGGCRVQDLGAIAL